jgi:hypothetical protein
VERRRKRGEVNPRGIGTHLCQGSHLPLVSDHDGFHQGSGLEQYLPEAFGGEYPVSRSAAHPYSLCLFMVWFLVEVFESIDECHL